MVPRGDDAGDSGAADGEQERRFPQNPAVLRAAMEIVKRKKADAVGKEEYEAAARFHQKLQELEAQLHATEGRDNVGEASTGSVDAGAPGSAASGPAARPRSLLATPNPFRTVELLRQSGYSRLQAYVLLGLLYLAVFAVEMLLVYVGWQFLGRAAGDGASEDSGEEAFDEF
mmetsp:Transcript_9109/g.27620  ORF Transcript_9109/g.27620 Transcript_9109/m.27620 type:complete len:172 (-) Transcript_9109:131-646(-)